MKERPVVRIETLQVPVVIKGEIASLLDCTGRRIGSVSLSRLGPVSAEIATAHLWEAATTAMVARFVFHSLKQVAGPWERKAAALAASIRLRMRDRLYKGGRRRFEKFSTTTWPDAATRMAMQGHNRLLYHARSGWELWAHTTSHNLNARAEILHG